MSTWISDRIRIVLRVAAVCCGAALALSGCDNAGGSPGAGLQGFAPKAQRKARVHGGRFVVAGPEGFCIDRVMNDPVARSAFILLGSCASISRNPDDARPPRLALLTASVSERQEPGQGAVADRFARFFRTEAGRQALSRSGDAASVRVRDLVRDDDALFIYLSDRSAGAPAGVDPSYWRGVAELQGHVVTITVSSFASKPLSRGEAGRIARAFLAALRAANP